MSDVLRVSALARTKLTRNDVTLYEQAYSLDETAFTELAADRVVLATNMSTPEQYNLGGISNGAHVMIETDKPVLISFNGTTAQWQVGANNDGGVLMLANTSFTSIYFQNESTDNEVTAHVIAVE